MSLPKSCFGIYRERAHSPGRIDDDAAIMDAVADGLRERGFDVRMVAAESAEAALRAPTAIFAQCERDAILDRLQAAEDAGSIVINPPQAIRNTCRYLTVELFARHGVPAPQSRIVSTGPDATPPEGPVWVKRYDFHATEPGDVLPAADERSWRKALDRFAKRGMTQVVEQAHAPGDLIKFYGVAAEDTKGAWFDWFHHLDQTLSGHPVEVDRLRDSAFRAARAVGLEVFGGDAIQGEDGIYRIIDINAWPSFARRRSEAAPCIARHLAARFERRSALIANGS